MNRGQLFYRPMLVLTDGRHIPWSAMATGDARGQAACVARAQGATYAGAYAMLLLLTIPARRRL